MNFYLWNSSYAAYKSRGLHFIADSVIICPRIRNPNFSFLINFTETCLLQGTFSILKTSALSIPTLYNMLTRKFHKPLNRQETSATCSLLQKKKHPECHHNAFNPGLWNVSWIEKRRSIFETFKQQHSVVSMGMNDLCSWTVRRRPIITLDN